MNYSTQNNRRNVRGVKSGAKRVKNKVGIIVFRVVVALVLVGGFALAGLGIGAYMGILENAPKLNSIAKSQESFTTIIYLESTGEEIDRLDGGESREYVTIDKIPINLQHAFIAIEDERFYDHDGVDYQGFIRATYQTLFGNSKQGGSTITQQVIKNKLGIKRNTIETKLQEQMLATEYEKQLRESLGSKEKAKQAVLEVYLNAIALGKGQIGVQAASLRYFNKNVEDLTLAECCVIAAITQNPTGYNPITYPEENIKRAGVALDNMLEFGFITKAEYDAAKREDVYSKISETESMMKEQPSYHSYFNDALFDAVSKALQEKYALTPQEASQYIYYGGLSIYSTQDLDMQKIVDEAYLDDELFPANDYGVAVTYEVSILNSLTNKTQTYKQKGNVKNFEEVDAFVASEREKLLGQNGSVVDEIVYAVVQPQSAMVIIDYHNGEVKAIAGGRGEKQTNRGLNRATDSQRQPGSVFKVLASYAPAIDMGIITPATVFDDVPYSYGKYEPKNWYFNPPYRGLSTTRDGIRDSMNVITVKNMNDTGINNCLNYLMNFGFTTLIDDDYNLSTALGGVTYGVTQMEVTAAYGTIANEGMYVKPYLFTKVYNHDGEIILENIPEPVQVLKKTSAYLLTNMMQDVVTAGTGGQARFQNIKMPIAGKTGTTSDNRDLTFVGYTPYYVAGVWLGYDMPKPMDKNTKSDHMRLWRSVMEKIHAELPPKEFERPEGITTASICRKSGQLGVKGLCDLDPRGNMIRTEYFAVGTVPRDYCTVHRSYTIDVSSKLIATEYCPFEFVATVYGFVRPVPYEGTAAVSDRQWEFSADIVAGKVCDIHTADSMPVESENPNITDPLATPDNTNGTDLPIMSQTPTNTPFHPDVPTPTPTPIPVVTPRPDELATPEPSPTYEPTPTPVTMPEDSNPDFSDPQG